MLVTMYRSSPHFGHTKSSGDGSRVVYQQARHVPSGVRTPSGSLTARASPNADLVLNNPNRVYAAGHL